MSGLDDLKHKAQDAVGAAKEKLGAATGNEDLEAEGRKEQASADLKDAGQKVKDAFTD